MRSIRQIKHTWRLSAGFTLIEIMIIAPVVILVVSGFVALMISMVGDSLVTREQNTLAYETQDALDRIEQDTRLTTQFLATSSNQTAPQGSDSNFTGTAAFGSSNSLILGSLTTDKNPTDTSRQLIFYANQPNDCGTRQAYNRPFQAKIIYFIKDGSLWRRSIVPDYNLNATVNDSTTCSAPWQRNSCSPGYSVSTRCQTNDTEVMKNISTFTVKYLSSPDSTTDLGSAQALSANAIEVAITGSKTSKGRPITSTGTMRATKLNNIDVDLPLPNAPVVSGVASGAYAVFSWALVPNATSYQITYNTNGGSPTVVTVDNRTTSYSVPASRNDTVSVSILSKNSTGPSATAGTAAATIPAWYDCNIIASTGWSNYNNGYATIGYTKTKDDVVMLKGMITGGSTAPDVPICKLPPEYAPSTRLQFQNASNDAAGRLDVWPTGEVVFNTGSAGWYSLDGANFVANTAPYPYVKLTPLLNGWSNFGNNFSDAASTLDGTGRVHTVGLIKGGTFTNDTPITTLPANQQPPQYQHFPARGPAFNYMGIRQNGNINAKGIGPNDWYSIQSMFYPAAFNGWTVMGALANGWVNFDSTGTSYPKASYTKAADGIVTLKGLLKSGTSSGSVPIVQLPAGYRPKEKLLMHVITNGGYGRVDIAADGKVYGVTTNAGWLSFDGISFMGDQ